METRTIDRLFLELSQVTRAWTAREQALYEGLKELVDCKDLKDRIESPPENASEAWVEERRQEYAQRKPLAWAEARRLVERGGRP